MTLSSCRTRARSAPLLGLLLLCILHSASFAASIQGSLWLDRNCDYTKQAGEPAMSGWTVYLRGQVSGLPPVLDSTVTTSDGIYAFTGLAEGNYSVISAQNPEYLQTSPFSVDYRMSLAVSDQATGKNFPFKPIVTCDTTTTYGCDAGVDDFFSTANGPEPSAPSAGLLAEMNSCGSALAFFDQAANNACFGHTYQNCWGSCGPVSASLTLRLRASSAGSQDDEILLGGWPSPGAIWHASLSQLLEIKTNGADVSWDQGDTMTLTLDLARLPVADRGITNIMAALQDGNLDLLLRNNTEADVAGGDMGGG